MFTGLVEEVGAVRSILRGHSSVRIEIDATTVLDDARLGDSIAVNGTCLTVVDSGPGWWAADVVPETLARTNLGRLGLGAPVNLERPVTAASRLGGHVVLGHVDATVAVVALRSLADGAAEIDVELPDALAPYVVEKGSVALDGASLTVAALAPRSFRVALIPHTLASTTFGRRRAGDLVNLEVDYLAKIVARLAVPYAESLLAPGRAP